MSTIKKIELSSQKTIDLGRKISSLLSYLKTSEIKGNKYKAPDPKPQEQQKQ